MHRLSVVQRVGGVLLVLLLSGVAATETEIEQVKPNNEKADELRIKVRGPFTIALPPGWTAYDQAARMSDMSPEDRDFFNIVIFASVNLEELEQGEKLIAMLEFDVGELPSFFVQRILGSRGMSCEGMSKKAEKKLLKLFGGDVMFGPDRSVSQDLYSETISIGDCRGLRIRGRSKWVDGTEQVVDVHALSDGKTLYLFTLRNIAENYDKNLEIYEEAVSTVRLSRAWRAVGVVPGGELAGPAEGKGRVYVFQFSGSGVQLFDGHSYVGSVDSSQCYGFDLEPGTHLIWSRSGFETWFLRAGVKAGRTYYVHLELRAEPNAAPFRQTLFSPTLFSAGPKMTTTGQTSLKKINKSLAKHAFVVREPAPAEHIESMQEELGPMIDYVMAKWDKKWANQSLWGVLHEHDYVK